MKRKFWNVAVALAVLSSPLTSMAALAEPASTPVRIEGCAASKAKPALTFVSIFGEQISQPALPAMLMVDFTNNSARSVGAIDFGVVSSGKLVAMFRDTGMFAPNARIMHAFGISESAVPADASSTSCVPLRVQYADGTSWMNPSMPAH